MRFSIAIPAYKPHFLKEAVESVLCQTCADWELVIVDDCSPSDLRCIVSPYLTDERIFFYRNDKNFGALDVVDNWNKCLEYCSGDYGICMGDDDKLLPGCLEDLETLISRYPSQGVYHIQTEIIDASGTVIRKLDPRPEFESSLEMIVRRWRGREQFIGDFCFDRSLLTRNSGFYKLSLAWGSDDISSFIAARGNGDGIKDGIANTGRVGFQYRNNGETITSSGNVDVKVGALVKCYEWFDSFFAERLLKNEGDASRIASVKKECRAHFKDVFRDYVKKDIGRNPGRLWHWINNRNLCRLSSADVCYQGLKGLVLRINGKV